MTYKKTNRIAWALAAMLGLLVLVGGGWTAVRLRPYWVARHHGAGARLYNADLSRANLRGASFQWADLRGARLVGADLRDACLGETRMEGVNVSGAVYSETTRSHLGTRWPAGFDPLKFGALKVQ